MEVVLRRRGRPDRPPRRSRRGAAGAEPGARTRAGRGCRVRAPAPSRRRRAGPARARAGASRVRRRRPGRGPRPKAAAARPAKARAAAPPRLGDDFLKGIGDEPVSRRADAARRRDRRARPRPASPRRSGARSSPAPTGRSIPAPAPSGSRTGSASQLSRNGRLARPAEVVGTSGVDDENRPLCAACQGARRRSVRRLRAARGLPAELYDAWKRGWTDFDMNYSLPMRS